MAPDLSRKLPRRTLLLAGAAALTGRSVDALDTPTDVVSLSIPGPGNSVSQPIEFAVKLGLDRAAGLSLRLRFVAGGAVAIRDLNSGDADFAIFGLPAAMLANVQGGDLVALAAIDGLPLYTLMVRTDLQSRVRTVADLRGLTVGVHSNSLTVRTTSAQLAELVLRSHGVPLETIRFVPAGQTWETQSAMMKTRGVDAAMCDEPIGERLRAAGLAYVLYSTGRPADAAATPGGGFLRATLVAGRSFVAEHAEQTGRVVDLVRRTLAWIRAHSAAEYADVLQLAPGPERDALVHMRGAFPGQYSTDARFSEAQLRDTDRFFRAGNAGNAFAQSYRVESMVVDRWVGRKP